MGKDPNAFKGKCYICKGDITTADFKKGDAVVVENNVSLHLRKLAHTKHRGIVSITKTIA